MVFKVDTVLVRIEHIETIISELESLRSLGGEILQKNLSQRWAVERGLQLGAEFIFDIGNHILSANYGVSAADYKDIVRKLAQRSVISEDLHGRLDGLAGFRNILVHEYVGLDPDIVLSVLDQAPRDFSDFAREIRDWLGERPA